MPRKKKQKEKEEDYVLFLKEDIAPDAEDILLSGGVAGLDEFGEAGGIGLSEIALAEEKAMDDIERREILVNPSDLQDIGDPEAGDVGVPGGFAAGGEMGEGGFGHTSSDPWGSELMEEAAPEPVGWGGVGSIESELDEVGDDRPEVEEEKL